MPPLFWRARGLEEVGTLNAVHQGDTCESRECAASQSENVLHLNSRDGQDTRLAQRLRLGIAPKGIRVRPRYRSNFVRSPRHLTI